MARMGSCVCLIDRAKREVVAGGEKEVEASVENFGEVVDHGDATDYASGRENSGLSEATYAHSSDDESSCTYCFGASTITLDHIREMAEKGYFAEGEAHTAEEQSTPEHGDDEVVIFEDFFITGLHKPPHAALAEILLKF
jgi:hypothetical protein